jgi:hypothetical protein
VVLLYRYFMSDRMSYIIHRGPQVLTIHRLRISIGLVETRLAWQPDKPEKMKENYNFADVANTNIAADYRVVSWYRNNTPPRSWVQIYTFDIAWTISQATISDYG